MHTPAAGAQIFQGDEGKEQDQEQQPITASVRGLRGGGKGTWKHAASHVATTIATPAAYAPLPFAVASLGWPLGATFTPAATTPSILTLLPFKRKASFAVC